MENVHSAAPWVGCLRSQILEMNNMTLCYFPDVIQHDHIPVLFIQRLVLSKHRLI